MKKKVYHLDLDNEKTENAIFALLPGDPGRVKSIAETLSPNNSYEIAYNREFCTWLSEVSETPVLTTSTGIGGPSTSIVIEELAQLGVKFFLRIGTTGAIQDYIDIGDIIITTGAVRLDGTSTNYAPIEYPAFSHYEIINALISAASKQHIQYHAGITCSTDSFYPGQERYDSYSNYVIRRFQGITEEWQKLNVLNYEMEAATLLTICNAMGLRGGAIEGVIINRCKNEHIGKENLKEGKKNAVIVAIEAVKILINANICNKRK